MLSIVPPGACPYSPMPKIARIVTNCPSEPGCRNATRKPSSVWFFKRSISSCLNVGCMTTSARMRKAGSALSDMTTIVACEASQCAPESIEPPSDSIALAICGALMVSVPMIKSEPVIVATPASWSGSTSAPFRTTISAARIGRPGRSTTTTRSPFSNFISLACEKVTSCGEEGAGAVSTPPMANAERKTALHRMTKKPEAIGDLITTFSPLPPCPGLSPPAACTREPPSSCR